MIFWLFGISATIALLAAAMVVIGVGVWLVGRPLLWWAKRPWDWDKFTAVDRRAWRAWERRKRAYLRARRRQRALCSRIRQESMDRTGEDVPQLVAWVMADDRLGLSDEYADVIDSGDSPPHCGPSDERPVDRHPKPREPWAPPLKAGRG